MHELIHHFYGFSFFSWLPDVYIVQDLLILSWNPWTIYITTLVASCNYGWTLMILFLFGRTWTNCLLKLKQLKGDTVCLKLLLAYLKFVDCLLRLCILPAVWETIMKLLPRTQSLKIKSLHILGNSNLHFRIQTEMEGHTRQVIQWLVNELADCAC